MAILAVLSPACSYTSLLNMIATSLLSEII